MYSYLMLGDLVATNLHNLFGVVFVVLSHGLHLVIGVHGADSLLGETSTKVLHVFLYRILMEGDGFAG